MRVSFLFSVLLCLLLATACQQSGDSGSNTGGQDTIKPAEKPDGDGPQKAPRPEPYETAWDGHQDSTAGEKLAKKACDCIYQFALENEFNCNFLIDNWDVYMTSINRISYEEMEKTYGPLLDDAGLLQDIVAEFQGSECDLEIQEQGKAQHVVPTEYVNNMMAHCKLYIYIQ